MNRALQPRAVEDSGDEFAGLRARVVGASRSELVDLLVRLEGLRLELLVSLLVREERRDDRLVLVEEAAAVLGVTRDWLYRHADEFSFTVRPGPGQLRFSMAGLQEYLVRSRS